MVGDDDGRPAPEEAAHRLHHGFLGGHVEVGRRLVQEHHRAVPDHHPGEGQTLPLPDRKPGARRAEQRCRPVRQPLHHRIEADGRQRPGDRGITGHGSPDAYVVGHRAGEEVGTLRHPGHTRPPLVEVELLERHPADPYRAGRGRPQAQEHVEQRRLTAPARPPEGHRLTRLHDEVEAVGGRHVPSRMDDHQPVDLDVIASRPAARSRPHIRGFGRRLDEAEGLSGRGQAVGTGMEVGAEGAQRQIGLGDEDQYEEGGREREVAAEQPETHGHGHERHRKGGEELEDQRGEEGELEGGERCGAIPVGDLGDGLGLRLGPAEDLERGQPLHDVEEVAGQSMKGRHPPGRALAGGRADEGHEDRNERDGHGHDERRNPVGTGHGGHHGQRHHHGEDHLGQVTGEVPVESFEPGDHQGGQSPCVTHPTPCPLDVAGPVEARRPVRPQVGDPAHHRPPQFGLSRGRGPIGRPLGGPGQSGPAGHHGSQGFECTIEVRERTMTDDGTGHDRCHQCSLEDHAGGRRRADEHSQSYKLPGGGRVVQQATVGPAL